MSGETLPPELRAEFAARMSDVAADLAVCAELAGTLAALARSGAELPTLEPLILALTSRLEGLPAKLDLDTPRAEPS